MEYDKNGFRGCDDVIKKEIKEEPICLFSPLMTNNISKGIEEIIDRKSLSTQSYIEEGFVSNFTGKSEEESCISKMVIKTEDKLILPKTLNTESNFAEEKLNFKIDCPDIETEWVTSVKQEETDASVYGSECDYSLSCVKDEIDVKDHNILSDVEGQIQLQDQVFLCTDYGSLCSNFKNENHESKFNNPDHYSEKCRSEVCKKKSMKNTYSGIHTGKKPFSCAACNKTFTHLSRYIIHTRFHTREKPFSCASCNKKFYHSSGLNSHMRIHTGEKPFSCDTCNKTFTYRGDLKIHTRIHTGEKPFSCATCNKKFSNSSDLTKHSKLHTGERPFSCNTCDKKFSRLAHLHQHTKIHTGEKPFSCNTCDKMFTHSSDLTKHSRIHTGEKPFACATCNKTFAGLSNFYKHTRTHTGEKLFSCATCNKKLSSSSDLMKHSRIHTGEKTFSCNM